MRVIYRKYNSNGDILACFPEVPADNHGFCMLCYQHIGQHGSAAWGHVLRQTTPATEPEYSGLARELAAIGYDSLVVCKRDTQRTRNTRMAKAGRPCLEV